MISDPHSSGLPAPETYPSDAESVNGQSGPVRIIVCGSRRKGKTASRESAPGVVKAPCKCCGGAISLRIGPPPKPLSERKVELSREAREALKESRLEDILGTPHREDAKRKFTGGFHR